VKAWAAETVLITLPLPSGQLSPNYGRGGSIGGRMVKAKAIKAYRERARVAAEEQRVESGPWGRATVAVTFFHAAKRRRDDVNHLAMLKPAYDGLVDARLLEDDDSEHLTTLGCAFKIDRKAPRVELLVTRTA
jgi:Holliday junction resolvase RusA-like endonuclease